MTKKRAFSDPRAHQLRLPLDTPGTEARRAGSLSRKEAVREALTLALSACPLSREDVALELSRLTGESISVNHIHNWASEAKRDWRFPAEMAPAFCHVTGDWGLMAAMLDGSGLHLADDETMTLAEYGRVLVEDKKRAAKRRELQERLLK